MIVVVWLLLFTKLSLFTKSSLDKEYKKGSWSFFMKLSISLNQGSLNWVSGLLKSLTLLPTLHSYFDDFWKNFRLKANPCCVPTSYGSRSVLLVTDEDNVAIVILNNLVATSCGCRWMPEHLLLIMNVPIYLYLLKQKKWLLIDYSLNRVFH